MKALPDSNSPAWMGLPDTAEGQLRLALAQNTLKNLTLLQGTVDTSSGGSGDSASSNPLLQLQNTVDRWVSSLPELSSMPMVDIEKTSDASSLPLDRCLAREVIKGRTVIQLVYNDLTLLR